MLSREDFNIVASMVSHYIDLSRYFTGGHTAAGRSSTTHDGARPERGLPNDLYRSSFE